MVRLRIYGPRPLLEEVTSLLQELGVMHIDRPPPEMRWGFRPLEPDESGKAEEIATESLLERLRSLLLLLPEKDGEAFPADESLEALDPESPGFTAGVEGLLSEAETLHLRLKELREEHTHLARYERVIGALAPLLEGVASSNHLELIGITVDRKETDVMPLISAALERITGGDFQLFRSDLDEETSAAVIVFGRSHRRAVRELLFDKSLTEIRLPGGMEELGLKGALGHIRRRLEELPDEVRTAERELLHFSGQWRRSLERARTRLADRLGRQEASRRFLCSRYCFFIRGWVPKTKVQHLRRRLFEQFGDEVIIEEEEKAPVAETPVLIENPSFVRPFEVFTRLLPLPAYGSVDPAPYFAFFFPIFFGLILGDIGYGLVVMAFAVLLWRRSGKHSPWRSLGKVFFSCSLFTVLFGVLFGEFFADLGERFHLLRYIGREVAGGDGTVVLQPLLYDRVAALTTFLAMAVIIGAVHVVLGLVLAMTNALSTRRYGRFAAKAGMLTALCSAGALIAALFLGLQPLAAWVAASVFAVALVGTTIVEGAAAPIEILSSIGNVLSYARIMAIGTASVTLGLVANRLGSLPDNAFAGILIALSLHLVNIVLGVFSPTIHGMRLHFVEFFGKFYEGGGKPYEPFQKHGGS